MASKSIRKFWALEIEPGQSYTQVPPYDLNIRNVSLGNRVENKVRNVLQCKVDSNTFVLGAVQLGETEQFQVDLTFDKGVPVEFLVDGSNTIHISGNYLVDSSAPATVVSPTTTPAIEAPKKVELIKSEEPQVNRELDMDTPPRKRKAEEDSSDASALKKAPQRVDAAKTPKQTPAKTVSLSISEDSPATSPVASKTPKKSPGTPKNPLTRTLPNGLVIEDTMVGIGKEAQPGKKVSVHYMGTFPNGKKFDSGRNFAFRLGTNSVIKGWDIGVKGMRVGGKRNLIIPPSLAYGKSGAPPDIPPNATLHFSVELVDAS